MTRRLLLLNGLAILGVILFHASGWGFVAMFSWAPRYLPVAGPDFSQSGSLPYYALRVIEQLIVFSLPAFMTVSGFFAAFAAGRDGSGLRWGVVGQRIRHLVAPYLFWSILLLAAGYLQRRSLSPVEALKMLATGGVNPAFYYVPLLCQLYLISPLLVPLARRRWKLLLVVAGSIQFGLQALSYPVMLGRDLPAILSWSAQVPKWFFGNWIFWFALGMVACFHLSEFKPHLVRLRYFWLVGALALLPLGIVEWELLLRWSGEPWLANRVTLVDALYAGCFILAFLAFEKASVPFSREVAEVGSKSFGIYLVHSPVMELAARLLYRFEPGILGHQILLQPILVVLGLAVPLVLMAAVKRSPAQKLYAYQFG